MPRATATISTGVRDTAPNGHTVLRNSLLRGAANTACQVSLEK